MNGFVCGLHARARIGLKRVLRLPDFSKRLCFISLWFGIALMLGPARSNHTVPGVFLNDFDSRLCYYHHFVYFLIVNLFIFSILISCPFYRIRLRVHVSHPYSNNGIYCYNVNVPLRKVSRVTSWHLIAFNL